MFEEQIAWFCEENKIEQDLELKVFDTQLDALVWISNQNNIVRNSIESVLETYHIHGFAVDLRLFGQKIIIALVMSNIEDSKRTTVNKVLFHELVHYRQYQSGRLRSSIENGRIKLKWVGRDNHLAPPWEIEAYAEQDFWERSWLTQKNKQNILKTNMSRTLTEPRLIDSQRNFKFLPGPSSENWYLWEFTKPLKEQIS